LGELVALVVCQSQGAGAKSELGENSIIAIRIEPYEARLKNRRSEVLKALEYVHEQQREIDENKEWVDKAAYLSRCHLLDSLADAYQNESKRINDALQRISEGNFGVCLACHESIQAQRLELALEAAFCAECQTIRELFNRDN
jgi:RNA polymerase-binding transcription factor DksA